MMYLWQRKSKQWLKNAARNLKRLISASVHTSSPPRSVTIARMPQAKVSNRSTVNTASILIHHLYTLVSEAQKKLNCDIVSIDWLLASVKQKKPLNTKRFLIRALGGKRLVSTSTSTTPKSSQKRKLSFDESDDQSRRTKSTLARVLANLDQLSALVDKASHPIDSK